MKFALGNSCSAFRKRYVLQDALISDPKLLGRQVILNPNSCKAQIRVEPDLDAV